MSRFNNFISYLNYLLKSKTAHGVHSPFVYKFVTELLETKNEAYYQFKELDAVRKQLLNNHSTIEITDFGAGSKVFKGNTRKISDIAKHGISTKKFSELYFKLINFCNAEHVVELGTSIGLNTLYLAKANSKSKIYTIEGCPALCEFSSQLFKKHNAENITSLQGNFDSVLPELLNNLPRLDFFYVDGNHQYEATKKYFEMALTKKHEHSVFIFDDINWTEGMQRAWEEIKNHPEVTLSLDLFYAGIVFFRKEQKEKEHFILRY